MPRLGTVTLVAVLVVLSVANAIAFFHARPGGAPGPADPDDHWQRWLALSPAQRWELVEQYEAIARRPDAEAILRRAREFGRLTSDQQERRRALLRVSEEILERQSPAERREFVRAGERVRAFLIYQALRSDDPNTLAKLRSQRANRP